jgi:hypothetical protein
MTAVAKVLSHTLSGTRTDAGPLKTIITLCGAGLVVSLLLAAYGLDLGTGVL